MTAKRFLTTLILTAILSASTSFADVTPQQVLADPRIGPYFSQTKKDGLHIFAGDYSLLIPTPSRTGGGEILAPCEAMYSIEPYDPETNSFSGKMDVYGEEPLKRIFTLDLNSEVPVLKIYQPDKNGNPVFIADHYAAAVQENGYVIWLLAQVKDGYPTYLYPMRSVLFPKGWYLGAWECSDGTQFTFEGNKVSSKGQEIGTFTVEGNRIIVTASNGEKDVIFAQRNIYNNTLVMTFSSGPNGMERNAGVFTPAAKGKPSPLPSPEVNQPSPPTPPSPLSMPKPEAPQKPSEPQMPTAFPKMPDVKMPSQNLNIDGVWGAYVNGQQWVIQYQGNNYYGWINGQPSEMGIFKIEGNKISGSNNKGVKFEAELKLYETGNYLDMRFPNGNSIRYQRLQ